MLSRLWHWRPLRWVFLGAAVVLLITFLVVQRQSIEVSCLWCATAKSY